MRAYAYVCADSPEAAVALKAETPEAHFVAGGKNQIDLMKMGIRRSPAIIDIAKIGLDTVEDRGDAIRIEALVSNTACAEHPLIIEHAYAVSMTIVKGATQQIRNMASVGGNLLRSPRSVCYYDPSVHNARSDGMHATSYSVGGVDRMNAILGTHPRTTDANPSDMAVPMMALGAIVNLLGPDGARDMPMSEFFRLAAQVEAEGGGWYALGPFDLITSADLPKTGTGWNQHYHKVRERQSYAFALVSGMAAFRLNCGRIIDASVAASGVARFLGAFPWRPHSRVVRPRRRRLSRRLPAVSRAHSRSTCMLSSSTFYRAFSPARSLRRPPVRATVQCFGRSRYDRTGRTQAHYRLPLHCFSLSSVQPNHEC